MSYKVQLDKGDFTYGRQFRKTFIEAHRPRAHGMPTGTPALLEASLARAEELWPQYRDHVKEYGLDSKPHAERADEGVISGFGWHLRPAITHLTLASELMDEFHWVMRLQYAPQEGDEVSDAHRRFANDANRVLNIMAKVVDFMILPVKSKDNKDDLDQEEMRSFLLPYALHLAERAVAVCKPEYYMFHHPHAADWLKRLARVQEAVGGELKALAKAHRTEAERLLNPDKVEPAPKDKPVASEVDETPKKEKRYLSIVAADDRIYKTAQELGQPVYCDIVDYAAGTITVKDAAGDQWPVRLCDHDHVIINTDNLDKLHGQERRAAIVEHIKKHGLEVQEIYKVEFFGDEIVTLGTILIDGK